MIRLVVNADDFGLSSAINAGILRAHNDGIVTSTTIVAAGRAFDEAIQKSSHSPALGIGVHLTLVEERAIVHGGTLAPDGFLPKSYGSLLTGVVTGRIRLLDIEREFRAQIEKCMEAGISITHLDSHQHTHAFPPLFPIARRLGREYDIRCIRVPRALPGPMDWASNRFPGRCVLSAFGWLDSIIFPSRTTRHFAGLFESGDLTEKKLVAILTSLKPGTTELMCHPAEPDPTPRYASWNGKRQKEMAAVLSAQAKQVIQDRAIQLTTFGEI